MRPERIHAEGVGGQMKIRVILNQHGGALRSLDLERFRADLRHVLEKAGHHVDISTIAGDGLEKEIETALADDCDVVMVGGGDGTVSTAAGRMMGSKKALAILPAGTMNLFARSLGIPLRLDEAVAAYAHGRLRQVDIATANGRPFVHQFSIGLHAQLIRLRERHVFRSRAGKIWASCRAAFTAMFHPPRLRVDIEIDGVRTARRAVGIGITNNLFGEGHLPYADDPDGGVLGIYVTRARRPKDVARMLFSIARGRWRKNDMVDVGSGRLVTLTLLSRQDRYGCAIDGELCPLEKITELRSHPAALNVLVPPAK